VEIHSTWIEREENSSIQIILKEKFFICINFSIQISFFKRILIVYFSFALFGDSEHDIIIEIFKLYFEINGLMIII
jgi:hypothetical protein